MGDGTTKYGRPWVSSRRRNGKSNLNRNQRNPCPSNLRRFSRSQRNLQCPRQRQNSLASLRWCVHMMLSPPMPKFNTSTVKDDTPASEQSIEAEHPPIDNEGRVRLNVPLLLRNLFMHVEQEQEERSDNDAVNELIGHLDSDKPTGEVDVPDDVPSVPAAPEESPAEVEEDEMQVDQEPIKHEEEEADESSPEGSMQEERQSLEPDAEVQEPEDADPPSSEPSPLSRVDGQSEFLLAFSLKMFTHSVSS